MPPSLQKRLGPQKQFFAVFSENIASLKELLNNKIFSTLFVIKKVMLIFEARRLLSLKNSGMRPKQFYKVFSENTCFFSKKLLNKKIFSI